MIAGTTAEPLLGSQPSPSRPAAPPVLPAQQLVELVQSWARAWSDQRVDAYLGLYASDFRPPGELSRGEWEAQRRSRILGPRQIEVQLSAIEVEPIDARRARVSFDQSYRSDNYRDTVRKSLELVREAGAWKILAERSGT